MSPRKACIIFIREDCFYPTEYPADYSDWQAEADRNPGTLRIETASGKVLWRGPDQSKAPPEALQ